MYRIISVVAATIFLVTRLESVEAQLMYWSDTGIDKIQRANLDGSDKVDIVTTGLANADEIALDRVNDKIYWTDRGLDRIQRANIDGTNIETLISTGLIDPHGIDLDVDAGKMYFSDFGTGKIQRANLDGSDIEDLVTTGLSVPEAIALDIAGGKMYWADGGSDTIERADLDGSNVETLVSVGLNQPHGIALDLMTEKVYWSERAGNKIQRANLDGTNVEPLITTGIGVILGLELDLADGSMYWSDFTTKKIQRANLDGTDIEDLVTTGLSNPQSLALDLGVVNAYQYTVFRGFNVSGDLSDTFKSDDSYLKFNPGITLSAAEPPVWLEFEGTLPTDNPTSLAVTLEAQANTAGLTQTIEMFNYISGEFEQVDSQAATNNDSVATVDLTANISDYVENGSGAVKTRLGWRATGPIVLFPWTICIDQVVWTVTE